MAEGSSPAPITIETVYTLLDKVSGPLQQMAAQSEKTQRAVEGLGKNFEALASKFDHIKASTLALAASTLGVGLGLHSMAEKALHVNRELEGMKDKLTGVAFATMNWGKGTSEVDKFAGSQKIAAEQLERVEEVAMRFATPAAGLVQAFTLISTGAGAAGLSLEKVQGLLEGSAGAAKALGVDTTTAAQQVSMAIQSGMIQTRGGAFGKYLTGQVGDMQKFRKMTAAERYEKVHGALEVIAPAGEKLSQGFDDTLFRIKKSVEDILGKVVLPLFHKLSEKLGEWQKKLHEIPKDTILKWSENILKVFESIGGAVKSIIENWKMIGGIFGAAAVGVAVFRAKDLIDALGSLTSSSQAAAAAISGVTIAAIAFKDWADKEVLKTWKGASLRDVINNIDPEGGTFAVDTRERAIGPGSPEAASQIAAVRKMVVHAKGAGLFNPETGQWDAASMAAGFRDRPEETARSMAWAFGESGGSAGYKQMLSQVRMQKKFGLATGETNLPELESAKLIETLIAKLAQYPEALHPAGWVAPTSPKVPTDLAKTIQQFNGDIHLHQDFRDVDPDRVFMEFKDGLESLTDRFNTAGGRGFAGAVGGG